METGGPPVTGQEREALEAIMVASDRDGGLMYPVFTNRPTVDSLVSLGYVERFDAGIFAVPRITPAGRAAMEANA